MGRFEATKKKITVGSKLSYKAGLARETIKHANAVTRHGPPQNSPLAFANVPYERNKVYLGFEWEVYWTTGGHNKTHSEHLKELGSDKVLQHYMFNSYDAGDIELKTAPMTLGKHTEYLLEHFCKTKAYVAGINTSQKNRHQSSRNSVGIHVHVDLRSFDEESLMKFILFLNSNQHGEFLTKIAGRKVSNTGCYNNTMSINNPFISYDAKGVIKRPDVTFKKTKKGVPNRIALTNSSSYSLQSYMGSLTRWQPDFGTVEVRMFATTHDINEVLMRLEFCDALTRYSRIATYKTLNPKGFASFVSKYPDKYPNLGAVECMQAPK